MHQQDRAEVLKELSHRFDVVIRGYDRAQVDDLLDRLGMEMGVLQADRDALASRVEKLTEHLAAAKETGTLRSQAQAASEPNFQAMGARISSMLKLAEEEAADIRRVALEEQTRCRIEIESATEQFTRMRTEARQEAEGLVRGAHEKAGQVLEEIQTNAASIVADAQKRADERTAQARKTVELAEDQSKSRMAKVAGDFDLSLKARKTAAARIEQERDQASRDAANTRLEQAQAEAENLIAAAEQRVSELETQRADVNTWLNQLRHALATVPAVDTTHGDRPLHANDLSTAPERGMDPARDHPSPNAQSTAQPGGSESSPTNLADPPEPESDDSRRGRTVLAREDILEYRHMRRSLR